MSLTGLRSRRSAQFSVMFWSSLMVLGLVDHLLIHGPLVAIYHFASGLLLSLLFFAWFMADATDHGVAPSRALKVSMLSCALVALPYYLVRYKGARGFVGGIGKFIALLALYLAYEAAITHLFATPPLT